VICTSPSEQFHWFIQLRKETLQHSPSPGGFGAFFGQSCDRDLFLFPFISEFLSFFFSPFLDIIAISDCVFNNKNNHSTRACWISNNYNHFGTSRLVGYLSYPVRPRCTQICAYPRAFMKLRVAQISLKIAHLSFSMGQRGPRAYGLRPRLWLLSPLVYSFFALEYGKAINARKAFWEGGRKSRAMSQLLQGLLWFAEKTIHQTTKQWTLAPKTIELKLEVVKSCGATQKVTANSSNPTRKPQHGQEKRLGTSLFCLFFFSYGRVGI